MQATFGRYLPLIAVVCGILPPCALGNDLLVPSQYPTIQAGIDAAVAGDTVLVADGTYTGPGNKDLDFGGKPITVRSASGDPALCIIDCEGSGRGFYFHSLETPSAVVSGFTIRRGKTTSSSPGGSGGGGVYCYSSNPTLTNCMISGNRGCGLYCASSAGPRLLDCVISGNSAYAGAGVFCDNSAPMLTNCVIRANTAGSSGGGVFCSTSDPTLTNCTISWNTAGSFGAGVACFNTSRPTLTNCTICGNAASTASWVAGGAVYCSKASSSPKLTNCVLWGDLPQEIYPLSGVAVVAYCDVQGGYTGTGNIDADPGFAFADDFHLMPSSPCVDAGTNAPTGGLPVQDADGNPRPLDGNADGQPVADMGAYEFTLAAPTIALDRTRIEFFVVEGQASSEPQTLSIRNTGAGMLQWRLHWDATWLRTDTLQGDSAGEVETVTLTPNAAGLPHGTYPATVTIFDPEAPIRARAIEVVLYMNRTLYVPNDYPTIQTGIDAASVPGDQVVVADGTYTGPGNKNLDFHGMPITLRSASGDPENCIIDCQGSGRGFYFQSGEPPATIVDGFTIWNGHVDIDSPAAANGAGVYCISSSPTMTNCVISGGSASSSMSSAQGGGVYLYYSSPMLTNCTISGNVASCSSSSYTASGGAVFCFCSSPTMVNCTIGNNAATTGAGLYFSGFRATLTNCTITGNGALDSGGGVYCIGAKPTLTNCAVETNTAGSKGAGIYCSGSNPTLTNCTISGNTAGSSGAGVYCYSYASPTLTNCTISGNTVSSSSWASGGAVSCSAYSSPKLANCWIRGNAASSTASAHAGAVYCSYSSSPKLTNCTITRNTALSNSVATGGGVYCTDESSSPNLTNCVLWVDTPQEIYVASGTPVVTYCDVQGGFAGAGNINADPLFVRNPGPGADGKWGTADDDYGDVRLTADSPCIDAGDNAAVPAGVVTDLAGNPRFVDDPYKADTGNPGDPPRPVVDMGAYEVPFLHGDANCDGDVGFDDISPFVTALVSQAAYEARYPGCPWLNGDIDGDADVSFDDINPFVKCLASAGCP